MACYSFDRLGPDAFEDMVRALLERTMRPTGRLIQFGDGPDGGREATWTQPVDHPNWRKSRRNRSHAKNAREWIFQAKFHTETSVARSPVETLAQELDSELEKITAKHRLACDTYVLITNLSLSGVRWRGSRERLERVAARWRRKVDDIQIWDAADISRMLDANPGVRQTYLATILPSDILALVLEDFSGRREKLLRQLRAYLRALVDNSGNTATARTAEAGDSADRPIHLKDIFVDLIVSPLGRQDVAISSVLESAGGVKEQGSEVAANIPASLAILLPVTGTTMLLAGPGCGKSTLCQFAALAHAARLLNWDNAELANNLLRRLFLPKGVLLEKILASCAPRIPFRIELKRFASWITRKQAEGAEMRVGLGAYIADELINPSVEGNLRADDIYDIVQQNPILLILDGLDEVPQTSTRESIIESTRAFLRRASEATTSDVQLLLSSRPQGYHQEFQVFQPTTWVILDLDERAFWSYCDAWLSIRIKDKRERDEARTRIETAMVAAPVRALATALLQVTVMLSIARGRKDIPHERTVLFQRFVDVVFEREKDKWPPVRQFERELRQLHASVAYQIQRRMEGGSADGLPEDDFRNLAKATWVDVRGDEVQSAKPQQDIEAIVEAAKDRLVFLKGQGEGQSFIGFLLTSYREYFAAQYLRNHEKADRDLVFDELVERESHWENVLRFFAGFQEPAVQRGWIERVSPKRSQVSTRDAVEAIRRRRMLLRLLPEFRELTHRTVESALTECLSSDSIWTWFTADWAVHIISGVRDGNLARLVVSDCLLVLRDCDDWTFRGAAWLVGGLLKLAPEHRPAFTEMLKRRLPDHRLRGFVVRAALTFDLEEILSNLVAEDLINSKALQHLKFDRIPESVQLDLLLREPDLGWELPGLGRGFGRSPISFSGTEQVRVFGLNSKVRAHINGGLFDTKIPFSANLRKRLHHLPEQVQEFCKAVEAALANPGVAEAHERVLELEKQWKAESEYHMLRHFARMSLGPPPSAFPTNDKYQFHWKRRVELRAAKNRAQLFAPLTNAARASGKLAENWLLGGIHPRHWNLLAERGLVSADAIANVQDSILGAVLRSSPCGLCSYYALSFEDELNLPPNFATTMLELISSDPDAVSLPGWSVQWLMSNAKCSEADIETTANRIRERGATPARWAAAIVDIVLRCCPQRTDLMLQLWSMAEPRKRFISALNEWPIDVATRLASCECETADDLLLAILRAPLRRRSEPPAELFRPALLRLAKSSKSSSRRISAFSALLEMPVCDEELELWLDRSLFCGEREEQWTLRKLSRRIVSESAFVPVGKLEPVLATLVEHRNEYEAEIVMAALERSLVLLTAGRAEMQDSRWQKNVRTCD